MGCRRRCAASAATPWQVGTRQLFIACTAGTTYFLLASSSADPACCGYSSDCILYFLPSSLQLCACSSCCWSGWAPTSRFPVAWPPWPDLPSCWWVGGCCALRWVGACGWCAAGGGECKKARMHSMPPGWPACPLRSHQLGLWQRDATHACLTLPTLCAASLPCLPGGRCRRPPRAARDAPLHPGRRVAAGLPPLRG